MRPMGCRQALRCEVDQVVIREDDVVVGETDEERLVRTRVTADELDSLNPVVIR